MHLIELDIDFLRTMVILKRLVAVASLRPTLLLTAMREPRMASITIRTLDEQTKARLRVRAARHQCSMEDEVTNILRAALAEETTKPHSLAEAIGERFRKLGGIDLPLPAREPMRDPWTG